MSVPNFLPKKKVEFLLFSFHRICALQRCVRRYRVFVDKKMAYERTSFHIISIEYGNSLHSENGEMPITFLNLVNLAIWRYSPGSSPHCNKLFSSRWMNTHLHVNKIASFIFSYTKMSPIPHYPNLSIHTQKSIYK